MPSHLTNLFFFLTDRGKFFSSMSEALNATRREGIFAGDNLVTYGKNLSFLEDETFMGAFRKHARGDEEGLLWRIATVTWAARNGARLDGDFVECACYKGTTARIVCDTLDLAQSQRRYFLYDLFEHDPSLPHHAMPEHGSNLFQYVKERFADVPGAVVTQGRVPESFARAMPEKIAFMHLDLNNAEAEIGVLEQLFERMVPGAVLVLDDYGWACYRKQKDAEDPWFAQRGYRVMELPTGQGLVIK